MASGSLRESFRPDWSGLAVGHAVRRSVTLVLILLASLALRRPEVALFPIVGSVVVGFGSIRALGSSRATPMLFAALGMALTSLVGSLVGGSPVLSAGTLAIAGTTFGLLAALGPGVAWVALNCLTFLLVLGLPFPATLPVALYHSGLVLAGGLLQTGVLTLFYLDRRRRKRAHPAAWFMKREALQRATLNALQTLFRGPKLGTEALTYGVRMAIVLLTAHWLAPQFHFPRASWVMMTAALVLKPTLGETLTRGLGRCAGTLAGGLFATALVVVLQPSPHILSALMVASAFAAYLVFYVNYALFTVFITSYVVFLLSSQGLPGPELAYLRVLATLAGGALALLVHFPWRREALA